MYICVICGGSSFVDFAGRSGAKCESCGSLERSRIIALLLKRLEILSRGMRVLHFAPERCLHDLIESVAPEEYIKADIRDSVEGIKVSYFDIAESIHTLPSDHFDLIIHNHVLEHLRCSDIYVTYHIHRALKPYSFHVFSIPIWPNRKYACDFNETRPDILLDRFGQKDHVALYGALDFHIGLGSCLNINQDYSLESLLSVEDLDQNNIPQNFRFGLNGSSVFIKRKEDWAFSLI